MNQLLIKPLPKSRIARPTLTVEIQAPCVNPEYQDLYVQQLSNWMEEAVQVMSDSINKTNPEWGDIIGEMSGMWPRAIVTRNEVTDS